MAPQTKPRPWRQEPPTVVDPMGRTPPHNLEAEAAVLSAMLSDARAIREVRTMSPALKPTHFHSAANDRICGVIFELADRGVPVDVQTVANVLKDRDRLQAIGGMAYLAQIVDATPAVAHVTAHAMIVIEKARVRRLADVCGLIRGRAYGDYGDATEFFAEARTMIAQAIDDDEHGPSTLVSAGEAMESLHADLVAQWNGERDPWGVPLPWPSVNRVMHGAEPGSVITLAAPEGEGKSIAAGQIAALGAGRSYNGEKVGAFIWTGEMPRKQYLRRLMVLRANLQWPHDEEAPIITPDELRTGHEGGEIIYRDGRKISVPLSNAKKARLDEARRWLESAPIYFDDQPAIDIATLRMRVRTARERLAAQGARLRIIVVDHFHLMSHRGSSTETETAGYEQTAQGIKTMALQEEACAIVLAQYLADAMREDRPPRSSDIRNGMPLRAISDWICHGRRPWNRHPKKGTPEADDIRNDWEWHITKGRDGKMGVFPLRFEDDALRLDEPHP